MSGERWPDWLRDSAWAGFVEWAVQEDGMIDAFNAATGRHYRARGVRQSDADLAADTEAFVLWVTQWHWGADEAPDAIRAKLAQGGGA